MSKLILFHAKESLCSQHLSENICGCNVSSYTIKAIELFLVNNTKNFKNEFTNSFPLLGIIMIKNIFEKICRCNVSSYT